MNNVKILNEFKINSSIQNIILDYTNSNRSLKYLDQLKSVFAINNVINKTTYHYYNFLPIKNISGIYFCYYCKAAYYKKESLRYCKSCYNKMCSYCSYFGITECNTCHLKKGIYFKKK